MGNNQIEFPIGDWSDDGHGKCETFLVDSNVSVETLRELHFLAPEQLGFEIGSICQDYGDCTISQEVLAKLKTFLTEELYEKAAEEYVDAESLCKIWLACLMQIEPTVHLSIVPTPSRESINFYGHDAKGRHLKTPGYGLFD